MMKLRLDRVASVKLSKSLSYDCQIVGGFHMVKLVITDRDGSVAEIEIEACDVSDESGRARLGGLWEAAETAEIVRDHTAMIARNKTLAAKRNAPT